jgi:two-component system cell cycle response regulator
MALAALHAERYGELMAEAGGQLRASCWRRWSRRPSATPIIDVAAAMMRDWGLPKLFTDAVLFHENPALADFGIESRSGRLAYCLHLATKIAHLCFVPQPGRAAEFVRLLPLSKDLGIPDGNLVALGDQMLREWNDWSAMLELGVREVVPFSALEAEPEVRNRPHRNRRNWSSSWSMTTRPSAWC